MNLLRNLSDGLKSFATNEWTQVVLLLVVVMVVVWLYADVVMSLMKEPYVGGGVDQYVQGNSSGPTLRRLGQEFSMPIQGDENTLHFKEDPDYARSMGYDYHGGNEVESLVPYRRSPNDWAIEDDLAQYQMGIAGAFADELKDDLARDEILQLETREEDRLAEKLYRVQ